MTLDARAKAGHVLEMLTVWVLSYGACGNHFYFFFLLFPPTALLTGNISFSEVFSLYLFKDLNTSQLVIPVRTMYATDSTAHSLLTFLFDLLNFVISQIFCLEILHS